VRSGGVRGISGRRRSFGRRCRFRRIFFNGRRSVVHRFDRRFRRFVVVVVVVIVVVVVVVIVFVVV
jgi:hypothetical protein